jgi:ATP synthase subunit 6
MNTLYFFSPLEQFEILPLVVLKIGFFDFSLTNQTIILVLILFFITAFFFSLLKQSNSSLFVIPTRFQAVIEILYDTVLSLVIDNVKNKTAQMFFPFIFSLFCFIASMNIIGLVPYSFTVTSHFIVTLAISLIVFIGINIIGVRTHKFEIFSLFLPAGTPFVLAFLLVPVELVLYIFRPFSLAIRLFCNMMAGHTLLKIFAGFAWSLMSFTGILFLFHYIPLLTLLPLFGLELAVALIQAFVFSLLSCLYLNDVLSLH